MHNVILCFSDSEMGRALIVQIGVVEDLIRRYKVTFTYQ